MLECIQEKLILQAISEGFVSDDIVAIDTTHIEARDQASTKEEKPKQEPKKRGQKSEEEQEKWLVEKAEKEANLPLYEKPIEAQLDASHDDLRTLIPINPKWGIKKNSEGKNTF